MEYVYAALVLHEAGKEIDEENVTAVLEAANVTVERSRVAALVAALEDVDITEAIQGAGAPVAPSAPATTEAVPPEEGDAEAEAEAEEEPPEEEDEEEEEPSGEGLGDLFG